MSADPPLVPLQFARLAPAEMLARAIALRDELRARRSVRHFRSDPVPIEILARCIEAAAQAPSGADKQLREEGTVRGHECARGGALREQRRPLARAREGWRHEQTSAKKAPALPVAQPWKGPALLDVAQGLPEAGQASVTVGPHPSAGDVAGLALVLSTLDEVRAASERAPDLTSVRAVFTTFVPSNAATALSCEGIAALAVDEAALETVGAQKNVSVPAPAQWGDTVTVTSGKAKVDAKWLAIGAERGWTQAGTARQPAAIRKK